MTTDTPSPQESTGTVTGPHDGRDTDGDFDHRYWRCERCGLETTDPRLRRGCFRCDAEPTDDEVTTDPEPTDGESTDDGVATDARTIARVATTERVTDGGTTGG